MVIPAQHYRERLPAAHHTAYDSLLAKSSRVIALDHTESNSKAHMDASLRMLDDSEHLIAAWDGQPARGYGGTADVVAAAKKRGLPVTTVWPTGATRD